MNSKEIIKRHFSFIKNVLIFKKKLRAKDHSIVHQPSIISDWYISWKEIMKELLNIMKNV